MNSNLAPGGEAGKDSESQLLTNLAELLEVETVKAGDVLAEFELWDSLTVLSVIAMLESSYGINLPGETLRRIKTVGELASMVESHTRK